MMGIQSKKSRKGKVNAVDVLFLLVLLFVLLVLVVYAFFSDFSFFDGNATKDEIGVKYTFVVEPVNDYLLTDDGGLPMEKGDAFYCLDHKISLGTVSMVGKKESYRAVVGESDGSLVYADYPGKSSFKLEVLASVNKADGTYYVDGHAFRIGDSFSFTTPYFIGTCRCIAIEEAS